MYVGLCISNVIWRQEGLTHRLQIPAPGMQGVSSAASEVYDDDVINACQNDVINERQHDVTNVYCIHRQREMFDTVDKMFLDNTVICAGGTRSRRRPPPRGWHAA